MSRTVRVRTGSGYPIDFMIDLGQAGVRMQRGRLSPLRRLFPTASAIALVGPAHDLLHSFNAIPLVASRPWLVTFEDYLPRTPDDRRNFAVETLLRSRLRSSRCVGLRAMSEYARRQFRAQHADYRHLPELEAKLTVQYPSVQRRRKRGRSRTPGPVRLLSVGTDFMRKGFPSVVRAHDTLMHAGVDVETTIVSSLRWSPDDYIGPANHSMYDDEMRRLRASSVRVLPRASNEDVMTLMDRADLLLFPTAHETFGFVAIEALAAGLPVITTDTCALPEIVEHGKQGFLIPMENDDLIGKWRWIYQRDETGYDDAYQAHLTRATEHIVRHITELLEGRWSYEELSAAAVERAHERFDRDAARRSLETAYSVALGMTRSGTGL